MKEKYDFPLANTLDDQQHLIFYKIMDYDVPLDSNYFLFQKKGWGKKEEMLSDQKKTSAEEKYSWDKKNHYMDQYLEYIKKYNRLYASIPFIQSIYLCNSITFNALDESSDIDVFIISKPGALRRARFWSVFLFFIFGLKRGSVRGKKKKFCLSFYVTQTHQNLYSIMLPQNDIYFIYWLAHLVPLYQETSENIYTHNKRLKSALPNFPGKHCINIGLKPETGKTLFKKVTEYIGGGLIGKAVEFLIKIIRLPIVIYKTKQLKEKGWGIIANDNILKFHMDIRKKIHLLYILYKKRMSK